MSNPADGPNGPGSTTGQVQETMEHVAQAASECCSAWSEHLREFADSAEDYVRKQPIKSLLIAAGIGMLVGLAVRR